MSEPKHRVSVDGGKYTFINHANHIEILRCGEPWGRTDYPKAIGSLMAELDASRVVLDAVRTLIRDHPSALDFDPHGLLSEAIERHAALVDDREPPSPWCTP